MTFSKRLRSWVWIGVWVACWGWSPLLAQGQMPATLTSGTVSLTVANAGTCTINSTGCAVLSVSGLSRMWVQVTGTFVGTLSFETTVDGTTWVAVSGIPTNGTTPVTTVTTAGVWTSTAGVRFRVRMSAYTSGTALVTVQAKQN